MQQVMDAFRIITAAFEELAEQLQEAEKAGKKEKLLDVEQIAAELNVPTSWVYGQTRITDGSGMPHLKIGKYCRFRLPEVMKWLQQRQEDK